LKQTVKKAFSVASPPFTNTLQWPHGIGKYPSNAHFRISPEVVQ